MGATIPFPSPSQLGGGGTPAPQAPSPDDLLAQIRDLLDQYLAMGADTPVAPEAQQLADAIDQSQGGGDMGSPAAAGGGQEPTVQPEHMMTGQGESNAEPPPSNSKTYAGANKNALARLKKRNKSS